MKITTEHLRQTFVDDVFETLFIDEDTHTITKKYSRYPRSSEMTAEEVNVLMGGEEE